MKYLLDVRARVPYQIEGFVAGINGKVLYSAGYFEKMIEESLKKYGKSLDKSLTLDFNAISDGLFGGARKPVIIDRRLHSDDDKCRGPPQEYPLIRYQRCINPNTLRSANNIETQQKNLQTFINGAALSPAAENEYLILRHKTDSSLPFEIVVGCTQNDESADFKVYLRNFPTEKEIKGKHFKHNLLNKRDLSIVDIEKMVENDKEILTGMYFINAFKTYLGNDRYATTHTRLWEMQSSNGMLCNNEDIINYLGEMTNKFILRKKGQNQLTDFDIINCVMDYALKQGKL